jgi:HSP20 family protein
MPNLIRYNQVNDAFDDLFHGFLMRPVRMDEGKELQIKLDVKEDDKAYTVHAEIPGVKKNDIHITIDGNQISISAEVKNEKEVKEGPNALLIVACSWYSDGPFGSNIACQIVCN